MKSPWRCAVILVFALMLSSCTISHLQIRNKLSKSPQQYSSPCNIKYSVDVTSSHETKGNRLQKLSDKYVQVTGEVLSKRGCTAIYVQTRGEADFRVRVNRSISYGALPQEWLTGLSFGIIPSWGKRTSQLTYSFEDTRTKKKHDYHIDQKSFNHLVVLPVVWVNFITLNQSRVYRRALVNFLEGSGRQD
jgi:hypothetical protein